MKKYLDAGWDNDRGCGSERRFRKLSVSSSDDCIVFLSGHYWDVSDMELEK